MTLLLGVALGVVLAWPARPDLVAAVGPADRASGHRPIGQPPPRPVDRRLPVIAIAGLLTVAVSPWLGLVLLGGVGTWRRLQDRRDAARRRAAVVDGLPEAADLLALAVAGGLTVPLALATAGRWAPDPVGAALRRATHELGLGRPTVDALDDVAVGSRPARSPTGRRACSPPSAMACPWARASTGSPARPASIAAAGPSSGPDGSRCSSCSRWCCASSPPSASSPSCPCWSAHCRPSPVSRHRDGPLRRFLLRRSRPPPEVPVLLPLYVRGRVARPVAAEPGPVTPARPPPSTPSCSSASPPSPCWSWPGRRTPTRSGVCSTGCWTASSTRSREAAGGRHRARSGHGRGRPPAATARPAAPGRGPGRPRGPGPGAGHPRRTRGGPGRGGGSPGRRRPGRCRARQPGWTPTGSASSCRGPPSRAPACTVTVRYRSPTAVPLVGPLLGDRTLVAEATMRVE